MISSRVLSRSFSVGIAVVFALAAVFHLAAIRVPGLGGDVSAARHGVFVAVNAACAIGFARREPSGIFVAAFILLVAQQLVSHGGDLLSHWFEHGRLDVTSLVIVLAMPVVALIAFLRWRSYA